MGAFTLNRQLSTGHMLSVIVPHDVSDAQFVVVTREVVTHLRELADALERSSESLLAEEAN
ncbi:MAG: hypothetical protein V3W41_21890 [Planctomycetota bacterium]